MSKEEKNKIVVPYGAGHTKKYTKSVVSDFLVERDPESGAVHYNSDIHLILRQKNLHKTIGIDVLRSYCESLDNGSPESHQFSDDELFQLIDPKGINTITDSYEFAKYIEKHSQEINSKYKELKDEHSKYSSYL